MLAQRCKKLVALRHRQPVLILAEPVVVGVLFRCAVVCEADVRLEDLFKHRLKERKIARLLRPVPYVVGLDKQLLVGDVFIHRDLLHVFIEEFKQRDGLAAGGELIVLLA